MRIYLALAEAGQIHLMDCLDYPYRLTSYLSVKTSAKVKSTRFLDALMPSSKKYPYIMDSGLFTFLFGSGAGSMKDEDQCRRYAIRYVEDMIKIGWKHPIVECDVQGLVGIDACHKLREEVFDKCGMEVIYVNHLIDGDAGLRALAKSKEYIALSVPEFAKRTSNVARAVLHGLSVIEKEGKPKVHLLGNTRNFDVRSAYSCDSSSWSSAFRWGTSYIIHGNVLRSVKTTSREAMQQSAFYREHFPHYYTEIEQRIKNHKFYKLAAPSVLSFKSLCQSMSKDA